MRNLITLLSLWGIRTDRIVSFCANASPIEDGLEDLPSSSSHHSSDLSTIQPNAFLRETSCISTTTNSTKENGKESYHQQPLSCNKYQIKTLTSNPHRCIHITPPPPKDINVKKDTISCVNYPHWHDGKNGCGPYARNQGWCQEYGTFARRNADSPTASQACCACGGGIKDHVPKFSVGDTVTHEDYTECEFQVTSIRHDSESIYEIEVMEDCGDTVYKLERQGRYIRRVPSKEYEKGESFLVMEESDLRQSFPIELRKCREGQREQEFWAIPVESKENTDEKHNFILRHIMTNVTLGPTEGLDTEEDTESHVLTLVRIFTEENIQFQQSDSYLRIEVPPVSFSSVTEPTLLVNGHFGQSDIAKPEWKTSTSTHKQVPFSMWTLHQVNETYVQDTGNGNGYDAHAQWIEQRITSGTCSSTPDHCDVESDGLEYLKQLPPWTLLDVDRHAPRNEVKSRFRELSRRFHPDKRGGPVFEQIFVLLQQAYDGLKSTDTKEKEAFKTNAEVESQLFPHSRFVIELLPSHWSLIGNGTRNERYVISMASSTTTKEQEDNDSESASGVEMSNESQVWLLFLYSPRCSMSRTVVSFLELAAEHLQNENIRVGAYGCGIYGESLQESKAKGFAAWSSDPICNQFQRKETPNTHVVVESLNGYLTDDGKDITSFGKRVAKFSSFHAAAAHGSTKELWPRQFIDFAVDSKYAWEDSSLVQFFTNEDFIDPHFNLTTRIVVFTDDRDQELYEVHQAIFSSLPNVARRLKDANITVGTVACASELEDNPDVVDCSVFDVSWLPDIKIFRANDTVGISLLSEEFAERRDVQIAIESMANTLTAFLGLDGGRILDEKEEESIDESEGGGSCGGMSFDSMVDESLVKLDTPDEVDKIEAPDDQNQANPQTPDSPKLGNDGKPKLGNDGKPKLAESTEKQGKAKLANRSNQSRNIQYDKRKSGSLHRGGSGKVFSGSISGNSGAAIAG